jgi:Ca2+-transporting ATPase
MLWINFVTNGVQDIALGFEPGSGDELTRPPRERKEGLLSAALWARTAVCGLWMAMCILVMFRMLLDNGTEVIQARTNGINLVGAIQLLYVNVSQIRNAVDSAAQPIA